MKAIIGGLVLAVVCSTATAESDDWILVGVNEKERTDYSIKKGTGELSQNRAGEEIYVVVGKIYDKKSTEIKLRKWYVKSDDCRSKEGQLITLSLKGEYMYETDFVFDSGAIASSIAESVCGAYKYLMQEQAKKGI